MTLGERLYTLRTQKNMSQAYVANILGVSRQSVSKWENDDSQPDLDKITKLSDLFCVSTDYLLRDTANQPPNNSDYSDISSKEERRDAINSLTYSNKRKLISSVCFILIGIFIIGIIAVLSSIIPSYTEINAEAHPFQTSSIILNDDRQGTTLSEEIINSVTPAKKEIQVRAFLPFLSTYHLHWLVLLSGLSIVYGLYLFIRTMKQKSTKAKEHN